MVRNAVSTVCSRNPKIPICGPELLSLVLPAWTFVLVPVFVPVPPLAPPAAVKFWPAFVCCSGSFPPLLASGTTWTWMVVVPPGAVEEDDPSARP